jgi:energy-coupling factor transport system ATP-binding protein
MMKLDRTQFTQTLSGGQKQRLITAATLAMGQKILVFDEPLANLDREGSLHLMETLKSLTQEEGYAVLFVEHRLDMVKSFADKIVWMEDGKCAVQDEIPPRHAERIPTFSDAHCHTELVSASCSAPDLKAPCVEVRNLAFRIAGREVLRDVDFTVHRGERIVVLGENGCGKTTLLRLIARLYKPTGGEIVQHIDPALGAKASPRWFHKVGYVYQNPGYQLFMPQVSEEIRYGAERDADADCFSELFNLNPLAERHPHSLSEGQKRRLSIAVIAVQKPALLLLDEPTVGQDFEGLKRMITTLNSLSREQGSAMITVTHDFRCASALADRAIWIQDGAVYKSGGQEVIDEYFSLSILSITQATRGEMEMGIPTF